MIVTLRNGNAYGVTDGIVKNAPIVVRTVPLAVAIAVNQRYILEITSLPQFLGVFGYLVVFDETYIESMEKFLAEMKKSTLQLKSGDKLDRHTGKDWVWYSISLRYGKKVMEEGPALRHDDVLLPHWNEFANALKQYSHDLEEKEKNDRIIYIHNVELPPTVLSILQPALDEKGFTLELERSWS